MTLKNFIILFVLISLLGCTESGPKLRRALAEAGDNRSELEKVLDRYSRDDADSLKYRAAVFLISNMPGYGYYESEHLDRFLEYYPLLRSIREKKGAPEEAVDSINKMYGTFSLSELDYRKDIEMVDSAYLCNNIEWAFRVWYEQPWGRNVPFEDFCEYILPYRVGNERLTEWRETYYNKYNSILDEFRASSNPERDNPAAAAKFLTDSLTSASKIFFTGYSPSSDIPHIGPEAADYRSGSCRDLVDFALYLCRSLGIPAACDYMPFRGDGNVGHSWAVYIGKDGENMCQDMGNRASPQANMRKLRKMKVYRSTFSVNDEILSSKIPEDELAGFLIEPRFTDVTKEYAEEYHEMLIVPDSLLYDKASSGRTAYLCMSSRLSWIPAAVGRFTGSGAEFKGIDANTQVMRIVSIKGDKQYYRSDPFYIDSTGTLHFYHAGDSLQDITVFRKFSQLQELWLLRRMIGGVFEGSNRADFLYADTLHCINTITERLLVPVVPANSGPYRYVRYYGPPNGFCNIADMSFFDKDGIALKGNIIGTSGSYNGDSAHDYRSAVDGRPDTSFDSKMSYGGWVGLDFGKPVHIGKIFYTPRNRDNHVRPGDTYELFYCDTVWKSAGVVVAEADSILYRNIPANTIYLLNNLSRGKDVRVFSYDKGVQEWLRPE